MPLLNRAADRLERGLLGEPVTSAELTELVRLAHALPTADRLVPGPSADFVARLGVQLREEAARRPVVATDPARAKASRTPAGPAAPTARRTPTVLHLGGRGLRLGLAALAVVAIFVSGLGVASRSAVPGSLLYPVKELLDKVAVGLAGSHYDTGMTYLDQAQEHVSEARKLTASGAALGPVDQALNSGISDVRAAEKEFTADYAQTRADRDVLAMRDFATQVLPQLDALRPSLLPDARPTLDRLVALLQPYAAGGGLPGTLPGTGPGGTLPGGGQTSAPTSGAGAPTSGPGPSGASGATGPGASSSAGLPGTSPTAPGAGVSLPGASVTVGPGGGGVVVTPTIGPISPTVSISVPPLPSIIPTTIPPILPTTLPTLGAPVKVGDTVKILASPIAGLVGLRGQVLAVDTVHRTVTVQVVVLGLGTDVVLPYASIVKV